MANYFYASGVQIPIERDESQVAFVTGKLEPGLRSRLDALAAKVGRSLPGQVVVLPTGALDAVDSEATAKPGARQTVYRRGKELLVPLPEVRVEFDDEAELHATLEALAGTPHPVDVVDQSDFRLVLTPRSGSADDALDVANFLHEMARPALAAVRFLHFVPKPGPQR